MRKVELWTVVYKDRYSDKYLGNNIYTNKNISGGEKNGEAPDITVTRCPCVRLPNFRTAQSGGA